MDEDNDEDLEDDTLDAEFIKIADATNKEIEAKMEEACKALNEAVKLSEKNGIPFRANISFLGQSYIPKSFENKFPDVDLDQALEYMGAWRTDFQETGWAHSSIC